MTRTFKPDVAADSHLPDRLVRAAALLALLALTPAALAAQGDSVTATGWMRFRAEEPLPPLKIPGIYRSPWAGGPRLGTRAVGEAWQADVGRVLDSLRTARQTSWRLRRIYGRRSAEEDLGERRGVLGLSRKYADLAIEGTARLELRTERLKNLRCTPAQFLDLNSGCRGGFKAPRLDTYLSMRAGGLIGRRLHLNVDYDTERDFNASNNLQIYYQGLEDEVVRRVEVGTVTFRPPPSRFLTAAIPANNFGVNATFQVGALQLQGIAATQKGSVVAERTYQVGGTTVQPQDREVRDIDFESSRFFWVVDPQILPGFPAVDILSVDRTTLPPAAQINQGDVRLYRYRPSTQVGNNPNLGGINAVAIGQDPSQRVTAQWELLQRDLDYYVDPSGVWVALAARLDQNDYLAVSYRSAAGLVGTFPAQDGGLIPNQPPKDTLLLIVQPRVGATLATFRHEIRNVYRVAGADLDLASLKVNLTLNRSERPLRPGAQPTYLAELGLAVPADPNTFNLQDRLFPRARDPNASLTIKESYIVFPTVQPFADPARLLATERNDSLYRTPDYLLFTEGPPGKFTFRLRYNASSGSDRSSLDLGALQIREGSEALYFDGRRLDRGTDYSINYDLGQVSFLNPQGLFGNATGTIQARFEERGIFAVAPTQIYGIASRYSFGDVGGLNLMGIYQLEQSAFNRPQLGFEASAQLVGGVSTDLRFKPSAVTRFLNRLTSTPATAPSQLDLNAELAFTKPDPNRSGQAYLEEFEGDPGVPLSLRETLWEFGSRPQFTTGVTALFGAAFDTSEAVQLTWQNLIQDRATGAAVQVRAKDIDNRIQIAGQQDQLETLLYLTLHPDTAGGLTTDHGSSQNPRLMQWRLPTKLNRPRWRSMVTSLSSTGVDLSKNEFLEFWVFHGDSTIDRAGVQLVLDLGSVSEDAVAAAPESLTVTGTDSSFTGRQFVGLGRLDTEREPTGIFNAVQDDNGILGDRPDLLVVNGTPVTQQALCNRQLSPSVILLPWGDLSERCGNGNGALDAEDLDGDNQLDATGSAENTLRWVVDLRGTTSPYFVRDGVQSSDGIGGWRLYRIPLRAAEFTLGSPNIRLIKHLRMTVVAEPDNNGPDVRAFLALGRMRFLGSPWVRRADAPISALDGSTASGQGEIVASTVSTENVELGYTSPPGVVSGLSRKGGGQNEFGGQINERSLRLIARQISLGQRAEAYLRFPSGAQNLLRYKQLRWWARGRGPGWDPGTPDFQVFLRVGSDSRNFYQYRASAQTTTWGAENVVDLDRWRVLRAQIESQRLRGPADSAARVACGGDTVSTAYVLCDGPYLAFIQDPAVSPPNLADVQEIAAGILRTGALDPSDSAEVWIDDIRLVEPISKVGSAVALDARLVASDVGALSVSYQRQDGYFQQIGQDPSYRTSGTIQLGSDVRVDRFLPTSLGIVLPMQVSYGRTSVDPQLLTGTDIRGSDLPGLRKPESWTLGYNFALRRVQRGRSWLVRGFLDPLSIAGNFSSSRSVTELSQASSSAHAITAAYLLASRARGARLNLGGLVRLLPGFLRRTDGAKSLENPMLNLVPGSIRLSSGLSRQEGDLLAFQAPVRRPSDSLLTTVTSLTSLWRNAAGFSWQPLGMLTLSSDLASTRDLRRYDDSTTLGRLATSERKTLAGLDVGVERDRQLSTGLTLTPKVVSWLRPRFTTTSSFVLSRSLTSRQPIREDGDTAGAFILPQTLNNTRYNEVGLGVDIARVIRGITGDSGMLARATRRVRPFDISDRLTRSSTFDLAAFSPGVGYQVALGGLGSFLQQHGDSAIGAAEVRNTSFTSGAELPFGASLTLGYSRIRTTRFQHVPGSFLSSETYSREWPRGSLRFSRPIRGGFLSLIGVGTTFRSARGVTTLPSSGGQTVRVQNSSSTWNPDAQLTFRNGMNLTFSYNILDQENQANGNVTQLTQRDLTAGFNNAFVLPASISRTRRIVRSQLSALLSKSLTCLRTGTTSACTSVSDTRRQEYRANFDTDIAQILTGGLQFSYSLNDARSVDRKFSQIILTANFQLSLFAGDYR